MLRLEGAFLEELRADVQDEAAAAPTDVDGFIAWFEALGQTGPGQGDPLFDWLADTQMPISCVGFSNRKQRVKPVSTTWLR